MPSFRARCLAWMTTHDGTSGSGPGGSGGSHRRHTAALTPGISRPATGWEAAPTLKTAINRRPESGRTGLWLLVGAFDPPAAAAKAAGFDPLGNVAGPEVSHQHAGFGIIQEGDEGIERIEIKLKVRGEELVRWNSVKMRARSVTRHFSPTG